MLSIPKLFMGILILILISVMYQESIKEHKLQEQQDMESMYIETNYVYQPYLKAKPVGDKYCGVHQGTTICSDKAYTYEEKEELLIK